MSLAAEVPPPLAPGRASKSVRSCAAGLSGAQDTSAPHRTSSASEPETTVALALIECLSIAPRRRCLRYCSENVPAKKLRPLPFHPLRVRRSLMCNSEDPEFRDNDPGL